MGILESAKPVVVICSRDRARAAVFYEQTLGLRRIAQDPFADIFELAGGIALRLSAVAGFTPHEHTILGFNVPDVAAAVTALREKAVKFNIYPGFGQDELGIWTAPDGGVSVAWFNDPDGNVLSVTNA